MTSSLSKYILFSLLLLGIASVSHGQELRGYRSKAKQFVEKLQQKRCKKAICPAIKCAKDHVSFTPDDQCCPVCKPMPKQNNCKNVICPAIKCAKGYISFIPDGECCPVCKPEPALACSTVMCAACVGNEIPLFVDGECCPKCEPEKLTDCSLVRCAQPICSEGYEPVEEGCCGTCKLKPNCEVVQCITEPCPPVCTEEVKQPPLDDIPMEPCMMVGCMDPCFSFSDTGEYVPRCATEQQCTTKMVYMSGGGDHCPSTGCEEFVSCTEEVLEPCVVAGCMNPCSSFSDTGEEVPKCTTEQQCITTFVEISGGGDHCPPTGCDEFVRCE